MPVSKKISDRTALADLHERIARVSGFRLEHRHPSEKPAQVARLIKILEAQGRVLFVDGVGWVDSESVVRRYRELIGETRPTENLRKAHELNQSRTASAPQSPPQPPDVVVDHNGHIRPKISSTDYCDWKDRGNRGDPDF
jgi:hypothetical protein